MVDRLEARGLIDDAQFAAYWVEQRQTFRPRGSRALRFELRAKGVTIVSEPREQNVCYGALILDPDGSVVIIHQRKDGTAG